MYKDFHIFATASFVQQKYNVNHKKSLIPIKSHCLHKLLCFFLYVACTHQQFNAVKKN